MSVESNVALHIQEARKRAGLTQAQLAEKIDKGFSTVQKYEMGLTFPPLAVLEKISKVLNIPLGCLIYGSSFLLYGDGKTPSPAPTAEQIGQAYEKAAPPVQRTVEVALEPYMDKP